MRKIRWRIAHARMRKLGYRKVNKRGVIDKKFFSRCTSVNLRNATPTPWRVIPAHMEM